MKPLARWTIGPTTHSGQEILIESVSKFKEIYPEFDTIVCYNNLQNINMVNTDMYKQKNDDLDYPLTSYNNPLLHVEPSIRNFGAAGSGWKLCPPRLRIKSHELWLDNDIIIKNRIPEIDNWLKQNTGIISEGRCRIFGVYEPIIPKSFKLCAGLFGLPPNYDFHQDIINLCKKYLEGKELGHYDEQGLVAAIISGIENFILIPQTHLKIVEDGEKLPPKAMGFHFVGVNRNEKHSAWKDYKYQKYLIKFL
jgi:hypothetical protein